MSTAQNCFEHFHPPNYSYCRSFLESFTYSSFDAVNQVSNISPFFVGLLSVFPALSFWLEPVCAPESYPLKSFWRQSSVFSKIAFHWPARWQEERENLYGLICEIRHTQWQRCNCIHPYVNTLLCPLHKWIGLSKMLQLPMFYIHNRI